MNNQKYKINNIPNRDKSLLHSYKDKADFIQFFPKTIKSYSDDYDLYFITFTFQNMKLHYDYVYYREYFHYFRQRLDNALLTNSYQYQKRPILFLFPEENPQIHFHGLAFLHKQTSIRFQKKCVLNIEDEYSEKLAETVSSIRLREKFINPYSKHVQLKTAQSQLIYSKPVKDRSAYQQSILYSDKPILKVADYRIYPLFRQHQYENAFNYSVKNFIYSDFSLDDVIDEMKEKSDRAEKEARYKQKKRTKEIKARTSKV